MLFIRTGYIHELLWAWELSLERNSGLTETDWKTRNWKQGTSRPNFRLQAQACARQCVQLCVRAQGKPRADHRSRRKMKSYWNQLDKVSSGDQKKTAALLPRQDPAFSVMIGGECARRAAEEESSTFSLFSIFNEVGCPCINSLGKRQEKIWKISENRDIMLFREITEIIGWRKVFMVRWKWVESVEKNQGECRERMLVEMVVEQTKGTNRKKKQGQKLAKDEGR